MSELLSFKSCYRVETISPRTVFLFAETGNSCLEGKLYYLLAPFLKEGNYSSDELVERLKEEASPAEIYYALERLKDAGYLYLEKSPLPTEISAYLDFLGVTPQLARERLQRNKVYIDCIGNIDKKYFQTSWQICWKDHLQACHITVAESPEESNFTVLLVDDYLNTKVQAYTHLPHLLLIKPLGKEIWVGPLLEEKNRICWKCFSKLLKTNRVEEGYLQSQKSNTALLSTSIAHLDPTVHLALHLATLEVFKWIVTQHSALNTKIISFDTVELGCREHLIFIPDPCHCPSSQSTPLPAPLSLSSRQKIPDQESGSRCFSPEYTVNKLSCYVSPITGIIHSLTSLQQSKDSCLHLYRSGHNLALSNSSQGINLHRLRQFTAGKGSCEIQAKAGSMAEAIERYSGAFQGYEYRINESFQNLQDRAVDPRRCLLYSDRQYQEREEWNRVNATMHQIPAPFVEDEKMDWSPVWSLKDNCYKFLPTAFCYYGYAGPNSNACCIADSNGCAAGHFLEEAILQGFFELVERDCVATWWYNRLLLPCVDFLSFEDPYFVALTQEYRRMGRELWVIDITHDLGIPTFAALSRKLEGPEEILFGFGTHQEASIALKRALTEMNQMLEFLNFHKNTIKKRFESDKEDRVIAHWLQQGTVRNFPFLRGNTQEVRVKAQYSFVGTGDLLEDIHECQRRVEKAGLEMFVLDQSRREVDLKVVKVIVPELRHFWPRLASGRLYNIPVQLGWISQPLKEEEMNPIPMFF